mmetsp:Transcript_10705/g.19343  ORF Transcript_10705/g.19343 Transcript_10705/m.19343 type:complete len:471 (+) Transcript_10705:2423-3835(+)
MGIDLSLFVSGLGSSRKDGRFLFGNHGALKLSGRTGVVLLRSRCNGSTRFLCMRTGGEDKRRVLIVGGGLAGLAVAHFWIQKGGFVNILDTHTAGNGGATKAAAGLLHPFTPKLKKCWRGDDGVRSALELISSVGAIHAVNSCGVLRLAKSEQVMQEYYAPALRDYPDELEVWNAKTIAERCPGVNNSRTESAVYMPHAVVVNVAHYTQALWQSCVNTGRASYQLIDQSSVIDQQQKQCDPEYEYESERTINQARIHQVATKWGADVIVVAAGAKTPWMTSALSEVPVRPCRGQNLHFVPAAAGTTGLKMAVLGEKYLVPMGSHLVCGASFEYPKTPGNFESENVLFAKEDLGIASDQLLETVQERVYSPMRSLKCSHASVGVRALPLRSHFGSVPLAGKSRKQIRLPGIEHTAVWYFTGLGSRGLLHHALVGRMLVDAIFSGDETVLPIEVRRLTKGDMKAVQVCAEPQ